MSALLETRSLTVELPTPAGWVQPVDEVSVHINAGESRGLVGGSGSGQTMLSLLCPERRRLPRVFQDPFASLNPRMRVREIVAEPLAIHERALSANERIAPLPFSSAWGSAS